MPSTRQRLVFLVILALGLTLRLVHPGADPPMSLSVSNAEIMDGPWYLAEALDRTRGMQTDLPLQYRRPIFTALMRLGFIGGGSLERAHLVEALAGGLLIVLAAAATRRAFGMRAALVAATLLAVGFVPVGYGRAVVVYGPLAAALAGVFWLLTLGTRSRDGIAPDPGAVASLFERAAPWLAAAALLGIALGLQAVAIVMAPALAVGLLDGSKRRVGILAALAVAGGAAVLAFGRIESSLVDITVGKAIAYIGPAEPFEMTKRWLRAPFASGLWPKAPLICFLGWLGVLAAAGGSGARGHGGRLARSLAVWFVVWVPVFSAFQYIEGGPPPLRYFIPALVPAAMLAGWVLDRLLHADGVVLPTTPVVVFVWATLGFYWALGTAWTLLWPLVVGGEPASAWLERSVSFVGLFSGALVFGTAFALVVAPRWRSHRFRLRHSAAAVLVGVGLASDAVRLYPMLAAPTYSVRDANRVVGALVGPGATMFGPYAHALTYDAPAVARHMEQLDYRTEEGALRARRQRWTHLAVSREDGAKLELVYGSLATPLVPLVEIVVRDYPIRLYRFEWAQRDGYQLTALERRIAERTTP